jgi:arylsulfatase A-like enzyme
MKITPIPAVGLLLALGALPAFARSAEGARKPNVVLILADDLGWNDLGCYGADLHETPNLDRLARGGVRFTQAYAMSVCTPTRAALLTGKHAARLHMTVWREMAVELQERKAPPRQKLLPPAPAVDLPRGETTLAEMLQGQGHLTFHVGKWHLGETENYPEAHGFDVNVGGTHWGAPESFFHPFRGEKSFREFRYVPGLGPGKPGDELTDRLTDEAIRLVDAAGSRPFFLNLWYHTPHTPIEAKPELVARYEAKLAPGFRHKNATYAAMVHSLDENVGRLMKHLDDRGLSRDTLVVFLSDNGGFIGNFGGRQVTDNTPLRSGKGSLYEGGVRVPLIVRWPGVTPEGGVCERPVICMDLWPTLAEIVGHESKGEADRPDGLSLVGLFKAPTSPLPRRDLFFHYPHYYHTTTPASAVRSGDLKLIEYFEDGRAELYDLRADPGEARDLSTARPDAVADLRARLDAWRRDVGAQPPTPNPAYRR